jgi:hypothetical protein
MEGKKYRFMLRPSIHCQIKSHGLFRLLFVRNLNFPVSPPYPLPFIDYKKIYGTASRFEAIKKSFVQNKKKSFKTSQKASLSLSLPAPLFLFARMCVENISANLYLLTSLS